MYHGILEGAKKHGIITIIKSTKTSTKTYYVAIWKYLVVFYFILFLYYFILYIFILFKFVWWWELEEKCFVFLKEINTFIQQGRIKLIKSDS